MTWWLMDLVLLFCGFLGPGGYHDRPTYSCIAQNYQCIREEGGFSEGRLEAGDTVYECLRQYHEREMKKLKRKVL